MEKEIYKKNNHHQLIFYLMMALFFCVPNIYAQKILWDNGYPKVKEGTVGTYGSPGSLELKFSIADADLTDAGIEITLPNEAIFKSVTAGAGNTSGITFTGSMSGQTLKLTPSTSTIKTKSAVDLIVSFTVESCEEKNIAFGSTVLSGTTTAPDGSKSATALVRKPSVRIVPIQKSIISPVAGVPEEFVLDIDVTNGLLASSLMVQLEKDEYTTLSKFMLDDTDITSKVAISGNFFTITLDESLLNGTLVGDTKKKLKFTAVSNLGRSRNIEMTAQYPATSPVCTELPDATLTLTYPAIPGTPTFSLPNDDAHQRWVPANDLNRTPSLSPNTEIIMDGVNASYLRLEYVNIGGAGAIQVRNTMLARRSAPYDFAYIDTTAIKYSIDGGKTIKPIPASEVQVTIRHKVNNGYRNLLSKFDNFPLEARVTVNDIIDVGKTITFYWPIIQGNIYDNETYRPTISAGTAAFSGLQYMFYSLSGTGGNGEAAGVPSNTYGKGNINLPKFITSLPAEGMREGGKTASVVTLDLGSNYPSPTINQTVDIVVKFPEWIELDGSMGTAIDLPNGIKASGYPKDEGNNTYRVRYTNSTISDLTVKYKVKDGFCQGKNIAGEIEYWMDYNLGGNTPSRPVLKKIAKIYQPVTLLCEKEGFEMKDFGVFRITRGLKDSDENYVPDDGSPALDSEIRHDIYLKNDEGKIFVQGTTLGNYNKMYMLLTSSFKIDATTIKLGNPQITIGSGAPQNINMVQVSDTSMYLLYDKPTTANQEVEISIPFTAIEKNNLTKLLRAEVYMSMTTPANPLKPGADRVGTDKMGESFTIYSEAFSREKSNETIADNAIHKGHELPYFDDYHGNNFYAPYFKNEIRRLANLKTLTFELPAGYLLKSDLTIENRSPRDAHAETNPKQTVILGSAENKAGGRVLYTFDISSVFAECNTQSQADALPSNKWMEADDIFNYRFKIDLQATKGAEALGQVKSDITYFDTMDKKEVVLNKNYNIAYTGDRTSLSVSPSIVKANEETVYIPAATILNPNNYNSQMWFYIEGNAKNLKAVLPKAGNTEVTFNGSGTENRWVKLDPIPSRESAAYKLYYDPITPVCKLDSVKIYIASRFQDTAWSPDINNPIDPNDIDHVAPPVTVYIEPTLATVEGSTNVSSTDLVFGTEYTLTVKMDSKASESVVVDPKMIITIPSGQKYVAGSGKVEHPLSSTPKALPTAVENALISAAGSDANISETRTFIFSVADATGVNQLKGFNSEGISDDERTVTFTANFTPMCETPLTGIRFISTFTGVNLCGIEADGSKKVERSEEMFSGIASDYEFNVEAKMISGNRAFNEIRIEDKLVVTFNKKKGTDALITNDHMYINLPQYMNIKEGTKVVIESNDIPAAEGVATVISNNVQKAASLRQIKLSLPIDAINASSDEHGLNKVLTYTMDLIYTPDKSEPLLIQNPEQMIKAMVTTDKKFSDQCPDAPLSIGSFDLPIALVSASENPYKDRPVGVESILEIINPNFAGAWFETETSTVELSGEKTFAYTPTTAVDTTFYVSAVFNGVDYGRVPVLFSTVPSVDFTVTSPGAICKNTSFDLSTTLSEYEEGVTFKYYSDAEATVELTSSTVEPSATTSYYVVGIKGVSKSVIKVIEVTVLPNTTITTQPVAINVSFNGTITLSVVASGEDLTYQWKKDGADIAGATEATFTKANATKDDEGIYTVVVTSACDNVTSNEAKVVVLSSLEIVVTDPDAICEGSSVDLNSTVSNVGEGVTIKFYSDATATKELDNTNVSPIASTIYYVQASNGSITGEILSIKVEVLVKTAITTQPVAVNVNTNETITLSVVASGQNLTYQWMKDGVDIAGATEATYTKQAATENDKGVYTVVVSGDCGEVLSNEAVVNVYSSTNIIVTDPAAICEGNSIGLTQSVSGIGTGVTVKYYSDAAGSVELSSTTVSPNVTTTYYVQASNSVELGDILAINVTVSKSTKIVTQPISTNWNYSDNLTLSVVAEGSNLTYQWVKDGANIAGATSATYSVASATEADSGSYSVIVSGDCGSITSNTAVEKVYPSLDFNLSDPAPICESSSIDLAQLVSGVNKGILVKFYSDASATNELASTLVSPKVTTTYYVQASNPLGTTSEVRPIVVTVSELPTAIFSGAPTNACPNVPTSLSLQLTGIAPWTVVYSDGTTDYTLANINSASHAFDVTLNKTTTYTIKSVVDANQCQTGATAGDQVTITLDQPVAIVTQPAPTTFCPGSSFTLSVTATGTIVDYQWYKDGSILSGETQPVLTVDNSTDSDLGEYYVVVNGGCNSVTSNKVIVGKTLDKIIVQKWNSTLVANNNSATNGGYNFVSYKWYKDGALVGEKPYYTVGNDAVNILDMDAVYHAVVTTTDGQVFTTCPFTPVMKNIGIKLYPNPVSRNSVVFLDTDVEDVELNNAKVDVYTLQGVKIGTYPVSGRLDQIPAPVASGVYIFKFTSEGFDKSFNVIVQ